MAFLQNHRRARLALLSLGGVLATLLIAILAVGFLVDLGGLVETQIRAQAPKIKEQLGRDVRVGRVQLKLLPSVRLDIIDVAIEAPPGQTGVLAQPLVQIAALRARIALGSLILSLGSKIQVTSFEVENLRIQVARSADGHLSYQDILDKLATRPESPPPTPEDIERLGGIVLEHVALSDAGIFFYDLSSAYGAATPLKLDHIQFSAEGLQLFAPCTLTLDMAVMAPQPNFHLGLTVGPLPRDLQVSQPLALLRHVELSQKPIEIEPLLRFLPSSPGVGLGRARIEAKLDLTTPAAGGQLQLAASAAARGVILEDDSDPRLTASRRGQPMDARVEVQLSASPLAGDVAVQKLELSINDMSVTAQADLRTLWTTPMVNKLSLGSAGLLLERLVAVLPPTALPADTVLRGPLVLRGTASGSPTAAQVEAAIDLTTATLQLPTLNKPAGTPLLLELRGQVKGQNQGADIERFGLTLGPLALILRGQVRSGDDLDLKLDSGSVDLDRLLRLLPSVERSAAKARIDGDLRVTGTIKKLQDTIDVGTRVTMSNAHVDEGDLTLRGNAELSAQLHSTPKSADVKADLDLSSAQLRVPGSVNKESGVPMRLRTQVERSEKLIKVGLAELTLPGGAIRLVGQIDLGRNQIDIKMPPVDLDLSRLAQVLPALRKGSAGGLLDSRLRIGVSFDGNPNKLGSARARLDQFDMTVAGGTVKGSAEVIGLDQPRKLTFNFTGDRLDLDRILGQSGDSAAASSPAAPADRPGSVPPFLRRLEMNGRVAVGSGKFKGTAMRDLLLEVNMSGGKLACKTLRIQALGGSINASGSTVDFGPSRPRFALRAKLDSVDIGQVMALRGGNSDKNLTGQGSIDLSADGQGLGWADMAPRLTGQLGLSLATARLQAASFGGQIINPLINALGKNLQPGSAQRDLTMNNFSAHFRIDNGQLHTTSPIRFAAEEGALSLSGSIGLDKALVLTGNLEIAPKTISAATGGRVIPDSPIPVALRMTGSLDKPLIQFVDLGKTVAALFAAVMRGQGRELLNRALGGGGGNLPLQNFLGGGGPLLGPPEPGAGRPQPPALPNAPRPGLGNFLGR